MFILISTTGTAERPATDLGFLLHKHPGRVQRFGTSHGEAHVFYPEATDEVCTAALLLEIDPIALVRRGKGRGGSPDFALAQYVNDRPYAASSLLAVALRTVFRTAMKGVCESRPGLADEARPLRISLPAVPANGAGDGGGAAMVTRLFAPLGWHAEATPIPLDDTFPEWGDSRYVRIELAGTLRLADALQQLYVLLPVLDGAKHYWVAPDEVDKLLAAGEGWLADHPEQALIARRYLARRWSLTRTAMQRLELARLAEADDREAEEIDNAVDDTEEETGAGNRGAHTHATTTTTAEAGRAADAEQQVDGEREAPAEQESRRVSLAEQRREAILAALREVGATRVADLGCGQGELIGALLQDARITEVLGVDVSARALSAAARKLRIERMPERRAARVKLVQGALTYTDARLKGYDAAVLSEVIEHLDLPRLPALEYAVLGAARPSAVVVTTPNVEYNVRWESLPVGHVRHADHRFEWDRAQFRAWAERVAGIYGYTVGFRSVGPEDAEVGPPTQLALFRIGATADEPAGAPVAAATTTAATTEAPAAPAIPAASASTATATTPEGGETR
ncbi:3' terminal RNA ribose 2'-O-methyltransferase Hen1 [Kitasatospora sp. NPDC050543]|uniref:3' terminal RNA ribose 2'-O-methyltransferase Hen1 n=1 Tax=Kitasatospora sp. NPDC050543 TaxID=3364054 RepID=UPI0037923193